MAVPGLSCGIQDLFKKSYLFMVLLCWVFVAVLKLSRVAASRGYSPDVVLRLLVVVASLVAEYGL